MALIAPGCVTVDPRADYLRSAQFVTAATGVDEVYDPAADEGVEQRVTALMADGLSVDEAVRVALLNNRGLHAAFLEIGASRAEVVQSGLLSNPSLSLSLRFPEGGGRANLTAGFAQQIADLWQIPVRRRVAEAELEQVVLSAANQAVRLSSDVTRAYYDVIAAEKSEALAAENLDLVQRSVDLAQARFDAGEVGRVDVNLVRTNLINAQLDAMIVRRSRVDATNRFSRLLGLSRAPIGWTLGDTWPDSVPMAVDAEKALIIALGHRLDARVAALRVKAAQATLEREYRSVFPNVTLGFEAERPERRALPGRTVAADAARASIGAGRLTAPSIQSRAERRRERSQIIDLLLGPTLEITLPLWDQNQAQIAKAGYRVRELRAAYEDLLDGIAQDVADALSAIRSAQELSRFYETEALPHARQSVEAARTTYQAGEQSVLVLIEAQESLIVQQRAQVNVLRDLAQAQAELQRAVGVPVSAGLAGTASSEPADEAGTGDRP